LGLIRRYTNTTTSAVCHAAYNLLVSVGTGPLLGLAIAAELALAAATVYGIWSRRRQMATAINP
jgi:hypothetical protein